jgi:hypothetical protein
MVRLAALLFGMATVVASCGGKTGQGDPCNQPSDCGAGLVCLQEGVTGDGGACIPSQKYCERTCVTDADCAGTKDVHFGDTPACGMDCSGTKFCAPRL